MDKALNALLAIVSGVIGLAIVSVIFSKRGQAPEVITATGNALGGVIQAATNPYTGQPAAYGHAGSGLINASFSSGNSGGSSFDVGDALDIAAKVAPFFV